MDGIHDMGGMHGFGRVLREPNEPVFHARWEGRVRAMLGVLLGRGVGNIDAFRHAIERMAPLDYLANPYYGRWLAALERLCVEHGVATRDELAARRAGAARSTGTSAPRPSGPPVSSSPFRPLARAPRFAIGDAVTARDLHAPGHTRLPRYARGRRGVVVRLHPPSVFPDTNAHGRGEDPQHLYSVRFEGAELWGAEAEPRSAVHLDLFEPYLEPGGPA
jgi:nitrile hydratase